MPRDPRDCLFPSFQPHQPGCPGVTLAKTAEQAATRVRGALKAAKGDEAPAVTVLMTEDGPYEPNQVLHHMEGLRTRGLVTRLVCVWQYPDGFWQATWSDSTPGELLEAATALRLNAEDAFVDVQNSKADDNCEETPSAT